MEEGNIYFRTQLLLALIYHNEMEKLMKSLVDIITDELVSVSKKLDKKSNETNLLLSQTLVNQEYQSCLMELQTKF